MHGVDGTVKLNAHGSPCCEWIWMFSKRLELRVCVCVLSNLLGIKWGDDEIKAV